MTGRSSSEPTKDPPSTWGSAVRERQLEGPWPTFLQSGAFDAARLCRNPATYCALILVSAVGLLIYSVGSEFIAHARDRAFCQDYVRKDKSLRAIAMARHQTSGQICTLMFERPGQAKNIRDLRLATEDEANWN